jgi:hypothetical protein
MADLLDALAQENLGRDALSRLEGFTRFHIRFHLPRSDQVFVSYMELRNLSDDNFPTIEAMRRQYEDALEDILRAGEAEGVFALPDTRVTTMALIAMLTGLSNWYRNDGRLETTKIEAIYWDLVRKSVIA